MQENLQEAILELHKTLTVVVLEADVGAKSWEKLVHNIEKRSEHRQKYVLNFLRQLEPLHVKVINIKTQFCATPEMWENMTLMFETVDFPEMRKLKSVLSEIKTMWLVFKEQYREYIEAEKYGA
jgi:hypothetical protein